MQLLRTMALSGVVVLVWGVRADTAPPRLLPADIPSRPQKSVLVRPPTEATPGVPTLAPAVAPATLQPTPASAPRLASPDPADKPQAEWQRVEDSPEVDSSRVVEAAASIPVVLPEPGQLASTRPLIHDFLRADGSGGLEQESMGLDGLLARSNDSSQRLQIIRAYWNWTFECARQRVYQQQQVGLELIESAGQEGSRVTVARALLGMRQQQNSLDLIEAKHRLATLALVPVSALTWPGDLPVVGKFRTEYDLLFQGRQAPPALEKINLLLPQMWKLLVSQAAAVNVLEKSFLDTLEMESWQQWEKIQLQYLETASRYNVEIANYVIGVSGQTASRERLVSMLIKPRRASQSVLVPRR